MSTDFIPERSGYRLVGEFSHDDGPDRSSVTAVYKNEDGRFFYWPALSAPFEHFTEWDLVEFERVSKLARCLQHRGGSVDKMLDFIYRIGREMKISQ